MALTNQQKADLAEVVIRNVANLVEFRSDMINSPSLANLSTDEIAAQLTQWLKGLPGEAWDTRLPDPIIAKRVLNGDVR